MITKNFHIILNVPPKWPYCSSTTFLCSSKTYLPLIYPLRYNASSPTTKSPTSHGLTPLHVYFFINLLVQIRINRANVKMRTAGRHPIIYLIYLNLQTFFQITQRHLRTFRSKYKPAYFL